MPKVKVSKKALWQAIRKNCLECCGGSYKEVETCSGGYSAEGNSLGSYRCSLFPYRLGQAERANVLPQPQNTPLQEGVNALNTHSECEVILGGTPK
jgi:hypothetical protein